MSNYLHALRGRNIPAYAGRTSAAWRSNNKPQKHPRIRGENRSGRIALRAATEASPHTRGKQRHAQCAFRECRNIPAYAGKAHCFKDGRQCFRKHPRIRGESCRIPRSETHVRETSPHTRGKLDPDTVLGLILGNIPAYAGKAHCRQGGNAQRQKHPRIRGESLIALLNICFLRETSPHTRGKPLSDKMIDPSGRNIPAYAGKASSKPTSAKRI